LIDNEQRLKPHPKPTQIIQAYVNFIHSLRDVYPHAQFLCVLGSMDITANNRWPDYLSRAITRIELDAPRVKIDRLLLPYSGYDQHPRVAQHQKMLSFWQLRSAS